MCKNVMWSVCEVYQEKGTGLNAWYLQWEDKVALLCCGTHFADMVWVLTWNQYEVVLLNPFEHLWEMWLNQQIRQHSPPPSLHHQNTKWVNFWKWCKMYLIRLKKKKIEWCNNYHVSFFSPACSYITVIRCVCLPCSVLLMLVHVYLPDTL